MDHRRDLVVRVALAREVDRRAARLLFEVKCETEVALGTRPTHRDPAIRHPFENFVGPVVPRELHAAADVRLNPDRVAPGLRPLPPTGGGRETLEHTTPGGLDGERGE